MSLRMDRAGSSLAPGVSPPHVLFHMLGTAVAPCDREVTSLGPLEVTLFLRYWGRDKPQWQQRTVFC